jgi:hypothetical protein
MPWIVFMTDRTTLPAAIYLLGQFDPGDTPPKSDRQLQGGRIFATEDEATDAARVASRQWPRWQFTVAPLDGPVRLTWWEGANGSGERVPVEGGLGDG